MKLMARLPCLSSFRDAPAWRRPGIHSPCRGYGFRVRAVARPGMTCWDVRTRSYSIRLRQAEHFFGDKTQDELRADRGDAGDQGFAQIALDVKFLGVAEAAMGHDRLLAGLKAGLAGEILRRVRRQPTRQALIVLPPRRERHQPRGL